MKRILSIIFAMFMGLALMVSGGVLLYGCSEGRDAEQTAIGGGKCTIVYNANTSQSVSNLPSSQITYANGVKSDMAVMGPNGEILDVYKFTFNSTITTTVPIRTGYTFEGWATSASGNAYYSPGSACTFTGTQNKTPLGYTQTVNLYAVWSENPAIPNRTNFYINANGGTINYPETEISELTVTNIGNYGFRMNEQGYFESQNKGNSNSFAMLKISFNASTTLKFSIRYISYGENNYDYAIFGKLNQTLSQSYSADSEYFKSTKGESAAAEKTITYSVTAGSHYIYVKYIKDGTNNHYDDSLKLFFEDGFVRSSSSQAYKYKHIGMQYGKLPTAQKSGYSFGGWYTSASGGTLVTEYSIFSGGQVTLYAHWRGDVPYTIYFDENYSGQTVNYYHRYLSYSQGNLTESQGLYTSQVVSGNRYSNFKIQKHENGSFVSQTDRSTVGILTYKIEKTVSNTSIRMGLNGSTADATILIDLSSFKNGTYIVSAELLSFSISAEGGTFGNIKIEKANSYSKFTGEGIETYMGNAYTAYYPFPTATREGYTFSGWYRKKNYLNMDAMMEYMNRYASDGHKFDKGSDGVYGWLGASAYTDDGYRIFPVSLPVGATFRLSYMARDSVSGDEYSTSLAPITSSKNWVGNAYNDCYVIRDTTWRWYETTFTVGSDFGGFSCGNWWGSERTFFKNIRLERMDINDFEEQVTTGQVQPLMSSHTLYASWSANNYTVSFNGNGATSGSMLNQTWTYGNWQSVTNSFAKQGYTFSGWDVSNCNSSSSLYGASTSSYSTTSGSSFIHNITGTGYYKNLRSTSGTVTFTARWTPKTYTVTFDANGGSVSPTSKSVTYNSTYGTLPTPTRENYIFEGWKNTCNQYTSAIETFTYDKSAEWKGGWNFCTLKSLGIYLTSGKTYRLSFDMKLIEGTNQTWRQTKLFINNETQGVLTNGDGSTTLKNVTTSWQRYTGTFNYKPDNNSGYRNDAIHIYPDYYDDTVRGQIKNVEILEEDSITSSTIVTTIGNHTLKAEWTPMTISNTVHLRVINKDGSYTDVDNASGGTVTVGYYNSSGARETRTQTEGVYTYLSHKGQRFELTANAKSGYAFVGFSTSNTPSDAIKNPTSIPTSTASYYPTSGTHYYVYFKQLSDNRLKYDEADKYFYFEDGYYPQSDVNSALKFSVSPSQSGVTASYDNQTNIMTLNGTLTGHVMLSAINMSFKVGQKYKLSVEHLSGEANCSSHWTMVLEVSSSATEFFGGDVFAGGRNSCEAIKGSGEATLQVLSNGEEFGKYLTFYVYRDADLTFNNAKYKVTISPDFNEALDSSAVETGENLSYTIGKSEEYELNGSNYYFIDKSKGYTDRLTVNLWAYKEDWTTVKDNDWESLISWVNVGGWAISINNAWTGYLSASVMEMGVLSYTHIKLAQLSKLSAGWHMFTMTFDGRYLKGYTDGALADTHDFGKQTSIRPEGKGADIVIGAECGYNTENKPDGNYYHGKIKDIIVEREAYSASQIEGLYQGTMKIPVYSYGRDRFVKISKNGETKWFKFEPIRWRISDYGVAMTERNIARYTSLLKFKNYASFSDNFVAVSDLILSVGSMSNTREVREGDSVQDLTGFQKVQNMTDNLTNDSLRLTYNRTGNIINVDQYSGYGSGQTNAVNKNNTISYSAPFRITSLAELSEVGLVNRGARASDMVAFILGQDKNNVSYWTRDLSNLGSGIAITSTGTQIQPWLDEMLGMRFSYTFKEGSAGGGE